MDGDIEKLERAKRSACAVGVIMSKRPKTIQACPVCPDTVIVVHTVDIPAWITPELAMRLLTVIQTTKHKTGKLNDDPEQESAEGNHT